LPKAEEQKLCKSGIDPVSILRFMQRLASRFVEVVNGENRRKYEVLDQDLHTEVIVRRVLITMGI
jgi:hypothetical protein